jgi:hypothetical protein
VNLLLFDTARVSGSDFGGGDAEVKQGAMRLQGLFQFTVRGDARKARFICR